MRRQRHAGTPASLGTSYLTAANQSVKDYLAYRPSRECYAEIVSTALNEKLDKTEAVILL
jgi:hypothetical protein